MILDASAVLAFLLREPGEQRVAPVLRRAIVSSVNHAEVLRRMAVGGMPLEEAEADLSTLGYAVEPFSRRQAVLAAGLYPDTRHLGLSLADRACLALAMNRGLPVYTADRAWAELQVGVEIRMIR